MEKLGKQRGCGEMKKSGSEAIDDWMWKVFLGARKSGGVPDFLMKVVITALHRTK